MNQSELEVNTCSRRQARENECRQVTIGVGDFLRPRALVHLTIKRTVYFSNTNGLLQSRSNNLIQSRSTIRDELTPNPRFFEVFTTRDSNFPVFTCTVNPLAHNIVMHLN